MNIRRGTLPTFIGSVILFLLSTRLWAVPPIPVNFQSLPVSGTQIHLSWTPSLGAQGYNIYRNGSQVGTTALRFFTDNGLNASTAYTYTVTAYDGTGESRPSSTVSQSTLSNSPPILAPAPRIPYNQIRSVTWIDYPAMLPDTYDKLASALPQIKATGFNEVLLGANAWWFYQTGSPTAPIYNTQRFAQLRRILDLLRAYDMQVQIAINALGPGWEPPGIDVCTWTQDLTQWKSFEAYVTRLMTELNGYEDMIYFTIGTENAYSFAPECGLINEQNVQVPAFVGPLIQATMGSLPARLPDNLRSRFRMGLHDFGFIVEDYLNGGTPIRSPNTFDVLSFTGYKLYDWDRMTGATIQISDAQMRQNLDDRRNRLVAMYPNVPVVMGETGARHCSAYGGENRQAQILDVVVRWSLSKPMGFNIWKWTSALDTDADNDGLSDECEDGGFGIVQNNAVTPRAAVPVIQALLNPGTHTFPTANNQFLRTYRNRAKSLTVVASDPSDRALTYALVERPAHGTVTGTWPQITYIPANGYVGADRFSFKVTNGDTHSSPGVVRVVVTPPAVPEVWRPANATWMRLSGASDLAWGNPADLPIPADYTGDGQWNRTVFRLSNGTWYRHPDTTGVAWGNGADLLVPADYKGDGLTQLAVYRRSSSAGIWYLQPDLTGVNWGNMADIPVPADYNGDGRAEIATFRPSNGRWYRLNDAAGIAWGRAGDFPVPADYDGDGVAELAVYRSADSTWHIHNLVTQADRSLTWGLPGDIPVPADYNGDGITDVAVWRPSDGYWYIEGQGYQGPLGVLGDIPVVNSLASMIYSSRLVTLAPAQPGNGVIPPDLSRFHGRTFALTDTLNLAYTHPATSFIWDLIPQNATSETSSAGSISLIPVNTPSPRFNLGSLTLTPGLYTLRVQALNGAEQSAWATATITLGSSALDAMRVYPNPWHARRGYAPYVTFADLPSSSEIKLFTVSGRWVTTLNTTTPISTWDMTTHSGDRVASGIYLYVIRSPSGDTKTGKITLIR